MASPSQALGDQGRTPWSTDDGADDGDEPTPAKSGVLDPGEVLGRYVVLYRLGTGGMGVVYAAYDPELDRKVALKLLRRGSKNAKRRRRARERLLREARAMARLSHPNVITVHDVAVFGGRVFMAMEHIEGVTLARALAGDGMDWPKVLDVMIKAGRGLVAAHDAGLVHRDFKPDNVMLAKDGRVVVMDFGLARALEQGEHSLRLSGEVPKPVVHPAATVSRANLKRPRDAGSNLAGTPAYMAPEQRQGEPTDARVDQFSFCVSLYEALYRQRPFRGNDADEIAAKIDQAEIEPPPASSKVPGWLRSVVLRGLSRDPTQRFASMRELLAALERDPAARRRRWLRWGAVGTAIAATAAALALAFVPEGPDECAGGEARLAGVWDEARRAAVEQAFLSVQRPYAEDAFRRAAENLDGYARDWVAMHRDACEANRVRSEQSDDLFDLRMECLQRRRTELAALTELFSETNADDSLVQLAVDATTKLTPVAVCGDTEQLRTPAPLPVDPPTRDRISAVREKLARAKALLDAGRFGRGLAILDPVVIEARDIDHAPLLAEALLLQGTLQYQSGDALSAERALREAARVAARGKHDETAARVWILLSMSLAQGQGRTDAAAELVDVATAAVERAGGDAALRAELANAAGGVLMAKADFEGAQQQFEEALESQRETVGEAHPSLARFYNNLAAAYGSRGKLQESLQFLERALEIQERNVGPAHPNVAVYLGNLGVIRSELGQEGALEAVERAIDIWRDSVGGDHPGLAQAMSNRSRLLYEQKRLKEAEQVLREAMAMQERLHREHPNVARAQTNLALILIERDAADEAVDWAQRGLTMIDKLLGDDHPERALALGVLGSAYLAKGDLDEAIPRLEEAYSRREQASGLGMRLDIIRSGVDFAEALVQRDEPGDRDRATRILQDIDTRLEDIPPTPAAAAVSASAAALRDQVGEPIETP